MATRLYLHNDRYDRAYWGGSYHQGITSYTTYAADRDPTSDITVLVGKVDTNGMGTDLLPSFQYAYGVNDWNDCILYDVYNFPVSDSISEVRFLNGAWYAGSTLGVIYRSVDAIHWYQVGADASTRFIERIRYGNNIFVLVGDGGLIMTSTDGLTWTNVTAPNTSNILSVAYSPTQNKWVAGGGSGVLYQSTNPSVSWTSTTQGTAARWAMEWSSTSNLWVCGGVGIVQTSTDGLTWTNRNPGAWTNSIYNGVNIGSTLYFSGSLGSLLSSTDGGITWTVISSASVAGTNPGPDILNNFYCPSSTSDGDILLHGDAGQTYKYTVSTGAWSTIGGTQASSSTTISDLSFSNESLYELRSMDTTIGTGQVAIPYTNGVATSRMTFGMFASNPLDVAQTVGGGSMILNTANQADTNSGAIQITSMAVYVWRPTTNSIVGFVIDSSATSLGGTPTSGTSETVQHVTGIATSAVAAAAGDIIICEIWANWTNGGMSTINRFFFDGTTVNTTQSAAVTNHASFIEFSENLTFTTSRGTMKYLVFTGGEQNWAVPSDWNNDYNTVEMIGSGANGATNPFTITPLGGNGGAGGAYTKFQNVNLTIGASYTINAGFTGAGDDENSWMRTDSPNNPTPPTTVLEGIRANAGSFTTGGTGLGGTLSYSGGNGGVGSTTLSTYGGGGGSGNRVGAGTNGGNGDTATAGNEGGGGGGAAGGPLSTAGANGSTTGGAGGTGPTGTAGGAGAVSVNAPGISGTNGAGGGGALGPNAIDFGGFGGSADSGNIWINIDGTDYGAWGGGGGGAANPTSGQQTGGGNVFGYGGGGGGGNGLGGTGFVLITYQSLGVISNVKARSFFQFF